MSNGSNKIQENDAHNVNSTGMLFHIIKFAVKIMICTTEHLVYNWINSNLAVDREGIELEQTT